MDFRTEKSYATNMNPRQFRNPYGTNWPNTGRGLGGTKVPRKPKSPKTPMPARAVAIKHQVKGY